MSGLQKGESKFMRVSIKLVAGDCSVSFGGSAWLAGLKQWLLGWDQLELLPWTLAVQGSFFKAATRSFRTCLY